MGRPGRCVALCTVHYRLCCRWRWMCPPGGAGHGTVSLQELQDRLWGSDQSSAGRSSSAAPRHGLLPRLPVLRQRLVSTNLQSELLRSSGGGILTPYRKRSQRCALLWTSSLEQTAWWPEICQNCFHIPEQTEFSGSSFAAIWVCMFVKAFWMVGVFLNMMYSSLVLLSALIPVKKYFMNKVAVTSNVSFNVHSLTKDHRKRPKYHQLLVRNPSHWATSVPMRFARITRRWNVTKLSLSLCISVSVSLTQEHNFIRRYEVLDVDVAGWFQAVMDCTESPRSSQCYSHQHQLHSLSSR